MFHNQRFTFGKLFGDQVAGQFFSVVEKIKFFGFDWKWCTSFGG